jgi:class 3 adenylate cyclase
MSPTSYRPLMLQAIPGLWAPTRKGRTERLKAHLRELVEPKIAEHRGRTVKNTGDGMLAEFASVVDAVRKVATPEILEDRAPPAIMSRY